MDRRLDRLAQPDLVLDDGPVREPHPERHARRIRMRRDPDERADDQSIDQAVRVVGQEEPPILDHADFGDVDLVGVLETHAADGRDREAGDAWHAPMLPDDDRDDAFHRSPTLANSAFARRP
jgi:hypothetical protein